MTPSLRHPGRVTLLVAGATLLNLIPIELPGDARLLLGAFAYMPAVLVLPFPWAVLAAAIPMAVTIHTLGHPFTFFIAVAEAAWLALHRRSHRRSAVVHDAVFWVLVSLPAFGLLYHGLLEMPLGLIAIVAAKQIFNQLAAVGIAVFLMRHTGLTAWIDDRIIPRRRMRDTVLHSVFILAVVPLMVVGIGVAMTLKSYNSREDAEMLVTIGQRYAQHLDQFLTDHEAAVASAAGMVSRGADAGMVIEELRRTHPGFITLLVADARGHISHTAPAAVREKAAHTTVSDREYFRAARDTNRPYVSGVFRGRGFGRDTLVAISAPIHDAEGRFQGIVEASLEVRRFARIIVDQEDFDNIDVILADRSGRVIFAEEDTQLPSLSLLRHFPQGRALHEPLGPPVYFDQPASDGPTRVTAVATRAAKSGVLVIAQRPLLAGLGGSGWLAALFAGAAVSITLAAVWVARRARHEMAAPLEEFARNTMRQAATGGVEPVPIQQSDMPYEVWMVYQRFNQLAVRLQGTYAMLRQTNEELDQRVIQRTAEAEAARRAAEEANQSKTDFLAMTSHEIRTPLNAIIGLAEALESSAPNRMAAGRLATIQRAGLRLLTVVNDLLDLSKVEAGKLDLHLAPTRLSALVEEIRDLLALRAQQQGIGLALELDPRIPPTVETDGARLQQVLINLVGNALKFTRTGGIRLVVHLEKETTDAVALRFAVIDTGPGIPPEQQARLFQPYVQLGTAAEDSAPGTGLGLAISRRLVTLLGGTLAVRSEAGAGAEFHFTLSLRPLAEPEGAGRTAPSLPPCGADGLRVLAVDDDVANQEVLRSMLETRCARLVVVGSAAEARQELAHADFDVALVDLEMPGEDGFSVAAWSRSPGAPEAVRHCRLIACSAHPRGSLWSRCAAAGFDDFVEKPINRALLLKALAPLPSPVAS